MNTVFDTMLSIDAFDPVELGIGVPGVPHLDGVVDANDFRAAMRRVPGAVTVLATRQGETRFGLTVTAVSSLSAVPPQLLACVNQASGFLPAVRKVRRLSVNYLASDQVQVSQTFATPTEDPEQRFKTGNWREGGLGLPVLEGAVASLECELIEAMPRASHTILIARIVKAHVGDGAPLLYHAGRYTRPETATSDETSRAQ